MELPLFPLRTVLFPGMELPLRIFEPRYRQLLRDIIEDGSRQFGVVLIRQGSEVGGGAIPYRSGTIAVIEDIESVANGQIMVTARGSQRFAVEAMLSPRPYPFARVRLFDPPVEGDFAEAAAAEARVRDTFPEYFELAMSLTDQWAARMPLPAGRHELVDFIAPWLQVDEDQKQLLIADESAADRLNALAGMLDELVQAVRQQANEHRRRKYDWLGSKN